MLAVSGRGKVTGRFRKCQPAFQFQNRVLQVLICQLRRDGADHLGYFGL
jgi:hypothetical protein